MLIHMSFTACFCSLENRYYVLYTVMAMQVKSYCYKTAYYYQPDAEVQCWFYVLASLHYSVMKKRSEIKESKYFIVSHGTK